MHRTLGATCVTNRPVLKKRIPPPSVFQFLFINQVKMSILSLLPTTPTSVLQQRTTNESSAIAQCYAVPYGWPGLITYMIGFYVALCARGLRTPLLPSRKLHYHRFNSVLAAVKLVTCQLLIARTYFKCFCITPSNYPILIMGYYFIALSLVFSPFLDQGVKSFPFTSEYKPLAPKPRSDPSTDDEEGITPAVTNPQTEYNTNASSSPSASTTQTHLSLRRAIYACLFIFVPTIILMIGTYFALQDPAINQKSLQLAFLRGFIITHQVGCFHFRPHYTSSSISAIPGRGRVRSESW